MGLARPLCERRGTDGTHPNVRCPHRCKGLGAIGGFELLRILCYAAETGTVVELALFVQNTLVANRSTNSATSGMFHLNGSELTDFTNALANTGNSVDILGTDFTEARIEVSGKRHRCPCRPSSDL